MRDDTDLSELLDTIDMESYLEREGIDYRRTHGRSGPQLQVKECPVCGNSSFKVYLNAESGVGNCLAGDTEIVTREFGVIVIERVSGQTVTLLDGDGIWTPCVIHDHGVQVTYAARFSSFNGSHTVRSTAQHGWIDPIGEIILTKDLRRKKDRASQVADLRYGRQITDQEEHARGVIHGLIYGDGNKEVMGNYRIRVCSHHDSIDPWLSRFRHSPIKGDKRFYIPRRDAWCEFKKHPDAAVCHIDYLVGFFRGWLAADGCVDEKGIISICCGVDEAAWIRRWAPVVGWLPRKHSRLSDTTNYGKRGKDSGNQFIATSSAVADDFLIKQHRERWSRHSSNWKYGSYRWTIQDTKMGKTKPYDPRLERVYCPEVSTTHSFALANGMHSRNCFAGSHPTDDEHRIFNKWRFIKAHLGDIPGRHVVEHIKQAAREMGWRPARKTSIAVIEAPAEWSLPSSYELPYRGTNLGYLEKRGIPGDIARYFHLRYAPEGAYFRYKLEDGFHFQMHSRRVLIPVYDLDGNLRTFQGRDVTGTAEQKYLFPPGLDGSGAHLFNGLNVQGTKRIVIGEGAFDVAAIKMALDQDPGLRDVVPVGTFGKHLSSGSENSQLEKFKVLKNRGLEEATFMWDGEDQATDDAIEASKLLRDIGIKTRLAMLPYKKDPNEVSAEVVRRAFYTATMIDLASSLKIRMNRRLMR